MSERYQIKRAAGIYWLLDMEQDGFPEYTKPVPLNDSAKELWDMLKSGMTTEEMAEEISAGTGIPVDEMRKDIGEFVEQLQKRGIELGAVRK